MCSFLLISLVLLFLPFNAILLLLLSDTAAGQQVPGQTEVKCPTFPKGNDSCTVCNLVLDKNKCEMAQKLVNAINDLDQGCSNGPTEQPTKKECNSQAKSAAFAMADAFKLFKTADICKHVCDNSTGIAQLSDIAMEDTVAVAVEFGDQPAIMCNETNLLNATAAASVPCNNDSITELGSVLQLAALPECLEEVAACTGKLQAAQGKATVELLQNPLETACGGIDLVVQTKCKEQAKMASKMNSGLQKFQPTLICQKECG